jgi:hypothetical protein
VFDLSKFTLREMTQVGAVFRKLGEGASTMEEVAGRIVRYLFDHTIDLDTGGRSCLIVRFFKTHPYGELGEGLQKFAAAMLPDHRATPSMKCLTLLATAGQKPEWNDRRSSISHQAIPLPSAEILAKAPMVSSLLSELGVEADRLLSPTGNILVESQLSSFNVFYVSEAVGSPYIPAQQEFALPMGLRSVLGFGGMLPAGEIFAVILFSKVHIPRDTADLFKTLALNVKLAVMPFEGKVFA